MRLKNAVRMIQAKENSRTIWGENFVSAEGAYSHLVFHSNFSVKIIGRGFDDFISNSVVMVNRQLVRCELNINLTTCIERAALRLHANTVYTLPAEKVGMTYMFTCIYVVL